MLGCRVYQDREVLKPESRRRHPRREPANQAARSGYRSGTVVPNANRPPLAKVPARASHSTVSATAPVNGHAKSML